MRVASDTRAFTVLLGVFAGLPAVSIDLSAPTLVDLPEALGTTATVAGLTLSLFMLGFAVGQVGCGLISDRFGRRPMLLFSLVVYTLAGLGCSLGATGWGVVGARTVQGAGAGACSVLASAIIQDLFEGEAARRKRSLVAVVNGVVPVVAPAVGAWLRAEAGWRSVHVVLAWAGIVLFAIVWAFVAESRWHRPAAQPAPDSEPSRAAHLLRDRRFLGLAAVNSLSYGALFAYIAGAPVVTMRLMGLSAQVYAGLFACTALALSAGSFASARMGGRSRGAAGLVGPSLIVPAASVAALLLVALRGTSVPVLLVLPLLVTCFTRGIIAPNLLHLTIGRQTNDAGLAAALVGVLQLGGGALSSAAVATLLPNYGVPAVAGIMTLMVACGLALWLILARTTPID